MRRRRGLALVAGEVWVVELRRRRGAWHLARCERGSGEQLAPWLDKHARASQAPLCAVTGEVTSVRRLVLPRATPRTLRPLVADELELLMPPIEGPPLVALQWATAPGDRPLGHLLCWRGAPGSLLGDLTGPLRDRLLPLPEAVALERAIETFDPVDVPRWGALRLDGSASSWIVVEEGRLLTARYRRLAGRDTHEELAALVGRSLTAVEEHFGARGPVPLVLLGEGADEACVEALRAGLDRPLRLFSPRGLPEEVVRESGYVLALGAALADPSAALMPARGRPAGAGRLSRGLVAAGLVAVLVGIDAVGRSILFQRQLDRIDQQIQRLAAPYLSPSARRGGVALKLRSLLDEAPGEQEDLARQALAVLDTLARAAGEEVRVEELGLSGRTVQLRGWSPSYAALDAFLREVQRQGPLEAGTILSADADPRDGSVRFDLQFGLGRVDAGEEGGA